MWPQLAEQKVISYTFKPELILTDDMLLVSLKMYGQLKSICVGVCVRVSSNVFLKNVTLFASHCFCFLIFFRCVAELLLTCVCVFTQAALLLQCHVPVYMEFDFDNYQ